MKNGQRLIGAGQKIFMLFHCPLDGEQFKEENNSFSEGSLFVQQGDLTSLSDDSTANPQRILTRSPVVLRQIFL